MPRIRFVMIGGFLGAGKTTTVGRLGRAFAREGRRVAIVTNDQAHDLVDTRTLRHEGFDVGEVPGACFCCKFDDLVDVAGRFAGAAGPDVILAEPVGSCTDLAATVIEPLRHLHADDYDVAPFTVLLKPDHGRKILGGVENAGFSPKAAYVFLKQVEEADLVAINKVDRLTPSEIDDLTDLVRSRFPGKPILPLSARTGAGFDRLLDALASPRIAPSRPIDVDYDVYAEGEAELGWLNCRCAVESSASFPLDDAMLDLITAQRDALARSGTEPVHWKIYGEHGTDAALVNLVSRDAAPELSVASEMRVPNARLVINARVAGDPEMLEDLVRATIDDWARRRNLVVSIDGMQRFRPGRPEPTHRFG